MQNLARGDGYGGDGLHLFPSAPSSAPLSTVIFLHGLGDTAAGWTDVIPLLASLSCFPALRVILPTAPVRPVTLNGGFPAPAWADIFSLDKDAAEDGPGFSASKARIDRIIQKEVEEAKVPPHRILLAGFSQGGALAYLVGLNSPYRLGGLVALSTWLPLASNLRVSPACLGKSQENPEKSEMAPGGVPAGPMPVLHCHGRQDELVRFEFGHESAELIRQQYAAACGDEKAKAAVQFQPFDGLGHSANAAELAQVRAFVEDILKHPV
ncbi:phospholipase/carboxylesterase [Besnoitia besnoiti]|uniref:Phospholipase/carboxylesterase n=1 Tax=Besnoitia besnoiti TaxID=94643 RepID=A0A2A9MAQ2_BESBE|nr:phospholipase/carboxylesterase [Besnoitia besnoiti]PFH34979.1 phospholipase/carboxylesterase [Besnoitia besnoiti]